MASEQFEGCLDAIFRLFCISIIVNNLQNDDL